MVNCIIPLCEVEVEVEVEVVVEVEVEVEVEVVGDHKWARPRFP